MTMMKRQYIEPRCKFLKLETLEALAMSAPFEGDFPPGGGEAGAKEGDLFDSDNSETFSLPTRNVWEENTD